MHSHPTRLPTMAEVIDIKKRKQIMSEGIELFNQSPSKGIELLCQKGLLKASSDPSDIADWLRRNPNLDKNKIADYICKYDHFILIYLHYQTVISRRSNTEVLKAFVYSFPFEGLRIDQALRIFLEAFRLPGEAAEISKIMQYFSGSKIVNFLNYGGFLRALVLFEWRTI
jgi:brefeldin A-resistance guanine nucleotide exchange factor 1